MDILVVGRFYTEGFALHVAETLSYMGHSVRRFEPGYRGAGRPNTFRPRLVDSVGGFIHRGSDEIPYVRRTRMRAMWAELERGPLDVIIVCYDFFQPAEVEEMRQRSKAVIAMWFPDHFVNFGKSFFMNSPYDALFFKDPFIISQLGDVLSSPVYYLPECFNPQRHRSTGDPSNPERYRCDITSAGNVHSWRVAFFRHLEGYDLKLWGNPPPRWLRPESFEGMYQGRPVLNEEKALAFLSARIVLNNLHFGEVWGLNARAFEAAGIGAFQMLDWRPGLKSLFRDGEEVFSYLGISDLKLKIGYWLPREDERREIASAGKKRAYAEHTYAHRLELLLSTLEGRERGFDISV